MTAATVCVVCSAVYPVREPHTCTYETPTRKDTPLTNHRPAVRPDHGERRPRQTRAPADPQTVRMDCLRLATETGMPESRIQQYADRWADFVLGTTKKEN